jgi:hypothetical protein
MEYLFLILLVIPIFVIYRMINIGKKISVKKAPLMSQSRAIAMVAKLHSIAQESNKPKKTQSIEFFDKTHPRILILEDGGYWISNNAVYYAGFDDEGLDTDNAVQLDTTSMNDVELKKLMFIVEQLTKGLGNEDSGEWN